MPLRQGPGVGRSSALGLALWIGLVAPSVAQGPAADPLPAPAAATPSAADYEARIQKLEAIVRQLQAQMAAGEPVRRVGMVQPIPPDPTLGVAASGAPPAPGAGAGDLGTPVGPPGAPRGGFSASAVTPSAMGADLGTVVGPPGAPRGGPTAATVTPSRSGGAAAPGQSLPPNPPPSNRFESPATLVSEPGQVKFGPGFEIKTNDEEFFFQFHDLTQFDYRGYEQRGQTPVHNTFAQPRQWFMFSGRITRPIGYFVSLQNGVDVVSELDAFVDLNYDPRLQGRVGRFKTPYTYEFLVEPIQGLINPERSVFFNNFGQNRDVGAMAYGRLFEGYVDYAAGVFNGTRNGYVAMQDSKFFSGLVNVKPFKDAEGSFLENLNLGGSVYTGNANQTALPQVLRTAVPTTGNNVLGVPFLTFNNSVREMGNQAFWNAYVAYYYRSLALISEFDGGAQDYSLTTNSSMRTRLPVNGFYVQAGYLLTGETRSQLGLVKPLHPFDIRKGQRGPGAWELTGRYQYLDIGNQVFTSGLSDPNTSANRVSIFDVGFNWHMTQYLKLYFEWEHSDFNQRVVYAPGKFQLTSDMFLVRFQLYF